MPAPYFYGADLLSKILSPNAQIGGFGVKNQKLSNLNEISACALFWRYWFQIWHSPSKSLSKMPKFGYFEPKSINFLILIFSSISQINLIFFIYPISKILISNPKFVLENFKMWAFWAKEYQLSDLNEILPAPLFWRCWFQIWHSCLKIVSPNFHIWVLWAKKY